MKKALIALTLIAGLIAAASFNVRIVVSTNSAQACDTNNCN